MLGQGGSGILALSKFAKHKEQERGHAKLIMVKLVVALSLCVGLAESEEFVNRFLDLEAQVEAMNNVVESCCGPIWTDLNGCGNPCAVRTISSTSFPTIESDKCYVVDGTFPVKWITVPFSDWWSGCWDGRW